MDLLKTSSNAVSNSALVPIPPESEDGSSEPDRLTMRTKGPMIDRRLTLIGSFNLDPRSIDIKTETGMLIDSLKPGDALAEPSLKSMPGIARRVDPDERGRLEWRATSDGQAIVETRGPQANTRRSLARLPGITAQKQL